MHERNSALGVTPPPAAHGRIAYLDSLRFVAAFAVLFQHGVEQQGAWGQAIVAATSPGVFGVVLFFLISGFVIPMSVGRAFDLRAFAIRRLCRLYPLAFATFALVALLAWGTALPGLDEARAAGVRDWVANLLLVQDYVGARPIHGVTWTLSLELAWYALFAILYARFGERFEGPLAIAFPVLLLAGAAVSLAIDHRIPLARPGMIYACVLGMRVFRWQAGRLGGRRLAVDAAAFLAVMAVANLVSFGHFTHPNITLAQTLVPWAVAPLFFLLVTTVPAIHRSPVIDNRALAWIGATSFSIYLLHPIALDLARAIAPPGIALPAGLVFTVVLSVAGFRLVERPGIALGRRLTRS